MRNIQSYGNKVIKLVDTVYTIGYSCFSPDRFIRTLREHQISLVVDVRSQPYSQRFPDYNKEHLAKTLKGFGIYYRNYAKEFGARQEDRAYYPRGYLDFELFSQSPPFQEGYTRLVESMKQGYRFTLMCAEKDPFNCHRTFLVARPFYEAGYRVLHLMPESKTVPHAEIEQRLLDKYFPGRDQFGLFEEALDESNYLKKAYQKRHSESGYSIEERLK